MTFPNLVGILRLVGQPCFQRLFSRLGLRLRMHTILHACYIGLLFFAGTMLYIAAASWSSSVISKSLSMASVLAFSGIYV